MASSNVKYTKDSELKGIDLSPLETKLDAFLKIIIKISVPVIGTTKTVNRTMLKVIESDGVTFNAKVVLKKLSNGKLSIDFTLNDPRMVVVTINTEYDNPNKFETDITSIDVSKIR